jgi:transposase-like protein
VSLLRQVEVAVANGKTTPAACREGGITEQTYYRWRKEYGGRYGYRRLTALLDFEALYSLDNL